MVARPDAETHPGRRVVPANLLRHRIDALSPTDEARRIEVRTAAIGVTGVPARARLSAGVSYLLLSGPARQARRDHR